MNMSIKKALQAAFPYTVPVMTGYLFLGMAFGVLLRSKGYHFGWAMLMSTFIYAGSMQFVAIGLLTNAVNIVATITVTLMVNARHLFYGLAMLDKFKELGSKKPYMIFALTDETFSLLCAAQPPAGVSRPQFYFCIALLDHLYWILGSVMGALIGSVLTINIQGIDFVMTALFVVIFVEQWLARQNHLPAALGIAASCLCLAVAGSSNFVIPSMLLILLILTVCRKKIELRRE